MKIILICTNGGRRITGFLDEVREIMDRYEEPGCEPAERLPETLEQWLLEAMAIDVKLFAAITTPALAVGV